MRHRSIGKGRLRVLAAIAAGWAALVFLLGGGPALLEACVNGARDDEHLCGGAVASPAADPSGSAAPSPSPATQAPVSITAPPPTPTVPPSPTPPPVYTFRDEFNDTRLKRAWGRHWPGFGWARWAWSQLEERDGVLRITATREGDRWVSGLIDTVGTFEQRYGVFEARLRYPLGTGLWPAFWLAQPQNPEREMAEIDVMEACAGPPGTNNGNDITVMNIYVHRTDGSHAFEARKIPAPNAAGEWHVYRVEWRPEFMAFYRDDVEVARMTDASEIPDMAMAIVLNLSGGGSFCGPPDPTTPRNAVMEVDWVRVTE